MKRNIILSLVVIIISVNSFSQSDTLNQLNSNGKKTGWWIDYLDENLKVLKDSVGASHCMYNFYRNDIYLYRFCEDFGTKKSPIIFPNDNTLKLGSYSLLNGTYVTKYKNGNTKYVLNASEGFMTNFKHYYPTGSLKFEVIVSKKCGAPRKHCLLKYNKDGNLKREFNMYLPKDQ